MSEAPTLVEAMRALASGATTSERLVDHALERITKLDPHVRAFISVDATGARAEARRADQRRLEARSRGPLDGIPFAVKDNIDVAGFTTTMGARPEFHRSDVADAATVARLRDAGAIVLGKTNLHEFAWGATTENEVFGSTRNPWDPTRHAHGSSGGSAVAVAAGLVTFALGSDTGGSIRNPAAVTGVTGLRPTHGLLDLDGVFPVAWTMDTVGPLARSSEDCAIVLSVMGGAGLLPPGVENGYRVGFDPRMMREGVDPMVAAACERALREFIDAGIEVVELDLSDLEGHYEAWLITQAVEAAVVHRGLMRTHGAAYSAEVRAQLQVGARMSADHYLAAQQHRHWLRRRASAHLAQVHALATPTAARTAAVVGRDPADIARARFAAVRDPEVFTSLASALAYPALSLPCGFAEGLPVGLHLVGPPRSDLTLLAIGTRYQDATSWHRATPALAGPHPDH